MEGHLEYIEPSILDNLRTLIKFYEKKHGEKPEKIIMNINQLGKYAREITGQDVPPMELLRRDWEFREVTIEAE